MNEELTREVLEAIKKSKFDCTLRGANGVCSNYDWNQRLATALLEERAKPKVWDGAPEDAIQAQITWFTENGGFTGIKTYNRELPKTRARKYAENLYRKLSFERISDNQSIDAIEELLNKYAEELTKKETN